MSRHEAPTVGPDPEIELVARELLKRAQRKPAAVIGHAIRQSIDEVLDGPRTGRWDFSQLEKTEKTYVGTKLEIVLRNELQLERGARLDLDVRGVDVDLKWAMDSAWQIPVEAVDRLCLCVGGLRRMTEFQAGLVRCRPAYLNVGQNRDRKRTLSVVGRAAMKALVSPTLIPSNFVADMAPDVRAEVMAQPTIQMRVTTLFKRLPYIAIPRSAVATIARTTGDPMRRVRADAHARDPLEGMKILSSKYGNRAVVALGYPKLDPDHFMAVPTSDLERLPFAVRAKLRLT